MVESIAIGVMVLWLGALTGLTLAGRTDIRRLTARATSPFLQRPAISSPSMSEISPVCSCGGTWGKWALIKAAVLSESRNVSVSRGTVVSREVKDIDAQKRTCTECGFTEIKRLTA